MVNRLLTTIIELEKSLQEEICLETERSITWRDGELATLAQELVTLRQRLADEEVAALAAARLLAEAEGARLLAGVKVRCVRLEALTDAFLQELLRQPLNTLLPEDDDDHPHGQD